MKIKIDMITSGKVNVRNVGVGFGKIRLEAAYVFPTFLYTKKKDMTYKKISKKLISINNEHHLSDHMIV